MTRATELVLTAAPNKYRCPEVQTVPKSEVLLNVPLLCWCSDCPHKIPCKMYLLAYEASEEGRLS